MESGGATAIGFVPAMSGCLWLRDLHPRNGTARFAVVSRPRRVIEMYSPPTASARPGIGQATLKKRELALGRSSSRNSPAELVLTVARNAARPVNVTVNRGRTAPVSKPVRIPCARRGLYHVGSAVLPRYRRESRNQPVPEISVSSVRAAPDHVSPLRDSSQTSAFVQAPPHLGAAKT